MLALATVTRKSFDGKLSQKLIFRSGIYVSIITDTDIGNLKSLHALLRVVEWVALIRFLFGVCHY